MPLLLGGQSTNLIFIVNHCSLWQNYPNKPMKVTIDIPDPENSGNYRPFIDLLEDLKLLANDRNEHSEKLDLILDVCPQIDQIFGLYPIIFRIDKFYEVVMSSFVGPNYAFFQAAERRYPVGEEKMINDEHNRFLQMTDSIANDVDTYPQLYDVTTGLSRRIREKMPLFEWHYKVRHSSSQI